MVVNSYKVYLVLEMFQRHLNSTRILVYFINSETPPGLTFCDLLHTVYEQMDYTMRLIKSVELHINRIGAVTFPTRTVNAWRERER